MAPIFGVQNKIIIIDVNNGSFILYLKPVVIWQIVFS